jgi:hypothetical protein
MRLFFSLSVIAAAATSVSAFAPANINSVSRAGTAVNSAVAVAGSEVKAKEAATLSKLAAKDQSAGAISKDVSYMFRKRLLGGRDCWAAGAMTHEVGSGSFSVTEIIILHWNVGLNKRQLK